MLIPASSRRSRWCAKNWVRSSTSMSRRPPGSSFCSASRFLYVVLAMASFLLLVAMAVMLFRVPVTGSFALTLARCSMISATAFGLLISSFVRSQVAALFGTALLTIPAGGYSSLASSIRSATGVQGRLIGEIFPTTHFVIISRGTFSKVLEFEDLWASFILLLISAPVLIGF